MVKQQGLKPVIIWNNPTTAVEPDNDRIYKISTDNADITLSGKSVGYGFNLTENATVRVKDYSTNLGWLSTTLITAHKNLTLDVSGTNRIKTNSGYSVMSDFQLKLSGSGSITLITASNLKFYCGMFSKNYNETNNQYTTTSGIDVSEQLAASGYKVYRSAISYDYDGTIELSSWTYYVSPVAENEQTIDLSSLTADTVVPDGTTLTGTLGNNVKISIADGATVTLNDVSINADHAWNTGDYAGLNCEGNAYIYLSGENTISGFNADYPGIHVPVGKTLFISGSGKLTARGEYSAGIGGGYDFNANKPIDCGNITIEGGDITAIGGISAAGIGGGMGSSCGNITIMGGTVDASGDGTGIGCGAYDSDYDASCGNITITGGTVIAQGGQGSPGIGATSGTTCGNITISGGDVEATSGSSINGIAAIGCAGMKGNKRSVCGDISIVNSPLFIKVKATVGHFSDNISGCPIGLSYMNSTENSCGLITFDGIDVNSRGTNYKYRDKIIMISQWGHLQANVSSTSQQNKNSILTLTPAN